MVDTKTQLYVRSFDKGELQQIKELKGFMLNRIGNNNTALTWNLIRDEAKKVFAEKIISAVDGLRKWAIKYDKKQVIYLGVKF